MEDWLETLRARYRINPEAEFLVGRGWRGIVERFYDVAEAVLVDPARLHTIQVKQKLGRLDIHVRVSDQHRTLINWHIKWAEDEASHTCEHCGSPYADLTPARHIIECEDCRYLALALDQRTRRASEIKSAARRYVRDCARAGKVLDVEEWSAKHWRKNSELKRKAMLDALRDEIRHGVVVADAWRRFDVPGRIARALIGARTYADLYEILRVNRMEPGFRPAEVARWVADGTVPRERGGEIFGIDDDEIDAFVSAWLAEDVRRRLEAATEALGSQRRFGGPDAQTSEIDMMEEATRLVDDVLKRQDPSAGD